MFSLSQTFIHFSQACLGNKTIGVRFLHLLQRTPQSGWYGSSHRYGTAKLHEQHTASVLLVKNVIESRIEFLSISLM